MYVFTIPAVWTKSQHHWTAHDMVGARTFKQTGRCIYSDSDFTELRYNIVEGRGNSVNGYLDGGGKTEEDF